MRVRPVDSELPPRRGAAAEGSSPPSFPCALARRHGVLSVRELGNRKSTQREALNEIPPECSAATLDGRAPRYFRLRGSNDQRRYRGISESRIRLGRNWVRGRTSPATLRATRRCRPRSGPTGSSRVVPWRAAGGDATRRRDHRLRRGGCNVRAAPPGAERAHDSPRFRGTNAMVRACSPR